MTKLPTSPDALRRLADAIDRCTVVKEFASQVRGMRPHIRWNNTYDQQDGCGAFASALSASVVAHWDLLVTAALADFDKEVLLAHAAVQDSMEEKS